MVGATSMLRARVKLPGRMSGPAAMKIALTFGRNGSYPRAKKLGSESTGEVAGASASRWTTGLWVHRSCSRP